MWIRNLAAGACLLLAVPTLAAAQSAPASEPPPSIQPASSNPSGSPLICKYFVYNGQTLPRRECKTAREWEILRRATQQNIRDFQRQSLGQQPN